jgi:hypothetical protein
MSLVESSLIGYGQRERERGLAGAPLAPAGFWPVLTKICRLGKPRSDEVDARLVRRHSKNIDK